MFPPSPRMQYAKSPLVQVICQVRFAPVLRIDAEVPAALQEALRDRLPSYQRKQVAPGLIVANGTSEFVVPLDPPEPRIEHLFLAADGQQHASLGRDFIALTTRQYPGWDAFVACMDHLIATVEQVYAPSHVQRAGLRYQNVVRRSKLGLSELGWETLLRSSVAGLLCEPHPRPFHQVTEAVYRLEDPMLARVAHGLVQVEQEESYLIDTDFFIDQQLSFSDVGRHLRVLHEQAGAAFRWCISDTLHQAMHPEPIP